MVSQFLDLRVAVPDFTSEIDLFAMRFNRKLLLHVSAVLDPSDSGNRCPGVHLVFVKVCFTFKDMKFYLFQGL